MMYLKMWGGSYDISDETKSAILNDPVWLALVKRTVDCMSRVEATK
jgi:hypothetical protein